MQKIEFKNLPSTDTPITAENLNAIQDNIENEINDSSVVVSATEPTTNRKKIWIQKSNNANKIYVKNDNDVYEEFKKTVTTTSGTIEYNANISSVDVNNWIRTGNVVSVAFRGLAGSNIANDSVLLTLPFKPTNPGTPMMYIGARYAPNSALFAYFSGDSRAFKSGAIESGKYVHIYFTYITNENE